MRFSHLALLAALIAVFSIRAHADESASRSPLPAALQQLLVAPGHRAALLQAAHAVDGPGIPSCPDATYATTGEIGILAPLKIGAGRIIGGAWKETMQQTGCGATRRLNAVTTVQPNGSLDVRALLPGTTITDPQLQQDSVQYAAAVIGDTPEGCGQGGVWNTRFVGVDGQKPGALPTSRDPPRPWSEVWTLQACAKRVDVTMHFTPDATGTDIRADPAPSLARE